MLIKIIPLVLWSGVAFAQGNILAQEKFEKISVPEKISQEMITDNKSSLWVFTTKSVYYMLGTTTKSGNVTPYEVITHKYDNKNFYIFICRNKETQDEYYIQYKNIEPKHVLLTTTDGTFSFMCHN